MVNPKPNTPDIDDLIDQLIDHCILSASCRAEARLVIRMWASEFSANMVDIASNQIRELLRKYREDVLADPVGPPRS